MSKKQERVKYLVSIHTALSKPAPCSVDDMGVDVFCFDRAELDQILATVKHLMKLEAEHDALQVKLIATAQELAELKVSNFKKSVDSQHFYSKK